MKPFCRRINTPILLLFRFKDEMAEVSKKKKVGKSYKWG